MEKSEQNQKSKPKNFDQPNTESGLRDEGATAAATATVTVQESPESPTGETRDAPRSVMYQTVMAELLRVRDKEQDDSSSIRSFSSSEGMLDDDRFNEIEEDTAVVDGTDDSEDHDDGDGQGDANETFRIEESDPKVEGQSQEPEQMASECQDLNDTIVEQKDDEPLAPPKTKSDKKLAGEDDPWQEADDEFVESVQAVSDRNEKVIAAETAEQSSDDEDVQVQPVNELSHEAEVQEVTSIVVNEPDGISVLNRRHDWNLLTSNVGTSLSLIKTNEDGTFKTTLVDGKEVLLTTPFPSDPTVVRESHQHVQFTYGGM